MKQLAFTEEEILEAFRRERELKQIEAEALHGNVFEAMRRLYAEGPTEEVYPIDWTKLFTPIELDAWCAFRGEGIRVFPQYPIGRYFADFADPFNGIVIECDGRAFHSKEKDRARNEFMISEGWEVFRIPGHVCKRVLCDPVDIIDTQDWEESPELVSKLERWFLNTVEGFACALSVVRYGRFPLAGEKTEAALPRIHERVLDSWRA